MNVCDSKSFRAIMSQLDFKELMRLAMRFEWFNDGKLGGKTVCNNFLVG